MILMNVFPTKKYNFRMNAKTFGRFLRCFTMGILLSLPSCHLMCIRCVRVYHFVFLHLINCFGYFQSRSYSHHSTHSMKLPLKQEPNETQKYNVWLIFYSPFLRSTHFTNDTWIILTGKMKQIENHHKRKKIYENKSFIIILFSLESVQVNV